jgi:hypothetical protein
MSLKILTAQAHYDMRNFAGVGLLRNLEVGRAVLWRPHRVRC